MVNLVSTDQSHWCLHTKAEKSESPKLQVYPIEPDQAVV